MSGRNLLLIIDPQNDFVLPVGALAVSGADADMDRLAAFINKLRDGLTDIIVTLDTHNPVHIATPAYWENQFGKHPEPFTTISHNDLMEGIWFPKYHVDKAEPYLRELEIHGKVHTIWPAHCLYSSTGWAVYNPLYKEIFDWTLATGGAYIPYMKGHKCEYTEMFSAIRAEVSLNDEDEDATAGDILDFLEHCDTIYVAGEAEDFCVKETLEDIMYERPNILKKVVLLKDCMSPIVANNPDTNAFWLSLIEEYGMKIATTDEF